MKSQNKLILLVALVCAAPFVGAWITYYFYKPEGGQSYGQLLQTKPVPALSNLTASQTQAMKGKWLLLHGNDGDCDKACVDALYPTRQARVLLNKETDRLVRVLIGQQPRLNEELSRLHIDVILLNAPAPTPELAELLKTKNVLIDPIGNQVIAWDRVQDLKGIKRLYGDLSRVMRASKWEAAPGTAQPASSK